jgi:hypothetical protein
MPVYSGPKIEYVVPQNGSEGISTSITAKVKFTEIMSADTLTTDYIYLRPFGDTTRKIDCTVTIEPGDNQVIVLNPNNTLSVNTRYEIVVVGANTGLPIRSILDNALIETYISSFTTFDVVDETPVDNGGGEEPEPTKPYVISSYPRAGQFNVSPTSIKIKFNTDISLLNLVVGDGTPSDFNLIRGEFLEKDIDDINILPITYVDGAIVVNSNILEFTPEVELENDTEYTIVLSGGKLTDTVIPFQSEFSYFFGDMKLIKTDLSKYIKISDNLLARYMADISKQAYETAIAAQGTIDLTDRPYYLDEYVRYKTAYELANIKYIEITTSSSMVTLGDFTVQNTVNASGLSSFMDGLRIHMKKWEDALHGYSNRGYAKPAATGKRETELNPGSGYPDYMDRRFKDLDGTKS